MDVPNTGLAYTDLAVMNEAGELNAEPGKLLSLKSHLAKSSAIWKAPMEKLDCSELVCSVLVDACDSCCVFDLLRWRSGVP